MALDKLIFQNNYFTARFESGTVIFESCRGNSIARLKNYCIEHGTVHNLREKISAANDWIALDHTRGLMAGDLVEIRNEYLLARANFPIRHSCRVLDVSADAIKVDLKPVMPQLCDEPSIVIVSKQKQIISSFRGSLSETRSDGANWHLSGENDTVAVDMLLQLGGKSSLVEVKVERNFKSETRVFSEKLSWDRLPVLQEVYRKNRKVDKGAFQRNYNVDRQGALFEGASGCSFWIYGGTDATSLCVRKADCDFEIKAHSAFRDPPHSEQAAVARDLTKYAIAKKKSAAAIQREGSAVLISATFTETIEIRGVRILWHRPVNKAIRVRATAKLLDNSGWILFASWEIERNAKRWDVIQSGKGVRTREVRLAFDPPLEEEARGIISIRDVDFLVGGEGFEVDVNLDSHLDHRYCRFIDPDRKRAAMGQQQLEARSTTPRKARDVACTAFQFFAGQKPAARPRIMHVPGGAQSMLLWTEHADKACLQSHRAAYFGRSDIENIDDAVGGFVGHGIVVTKSVFYSNPDRISCTKLREAPQAALIEDPEYMRFCREIAQRGHEICVHAPQPRDAGPTAGHVAAKFLADNFGARTWIDHSPRVVHCGMSGQGMNDQSPYYLAQTWRELGYKYFWHFACEDAAEERTGSINAQQIRLGDWMHTPLYWTHPNETADFISWPTVRGPADLNGYNAIEIDELISDWGIFANHTYPAAHFDPPRSQYLRETAPGQFESTFLLEEVLSTLESRIRVGEMVSCTVSAALEYWTSIDKVDVFVDEEGGVILTNRLDKEIIGFSIAIEGGVVASPELKAAIRTVNDNSICSFGFRANAAVRVFRSADSTVLDPVNELKGS